MISHGNLVARTWSVQPFFWLITNYFSHYWTINGPLRGDKDFVIIVHNGPFWLIMALIQIRLIRCMPITLCNCLGCPWFIFRPRTPGVRSNLDFFWTARLAQRDWSFDFGQNSFSDPRDKISFKSHQSSGTCSELPSRNH